MTVAKPQEYKIAFFSSPDLKSWEHLSDFGPLGATGGIWECPDLFSLVTPNGENKWVLLVLLYRRLGWKNFFHRPNVN